MRFHLGAQQVDKGGVAPGDAALIADEEEVFAAGGERRGKAVLDVADQGGLRPGAIGLGVGDVEARVPLQLWQAGEDHVAAVGGDGGGELILVFAVDRRAQFLWDGVLPIHEARNVEVVDAGLSRCEVEVTIGGCRERPVDAQVVDDCRQGVWFSPGVCDALGNPDVLLLRGGGAGDGRGGEEEEPAAVGADEGGAGCVETASERQAFQLRPVTAHDAHGVGERAVAVSSAPVDGGELGGEHGRGMQLAVEHAVGEDLRLGTRQGLRQVGLRGEGCRHDNRGGCAGFDDGVERAVNHDGSEDHQAEVDKSFHFFLQQA